MKKKIKINIPTNSYIIIYKTYLFEEYYSIIDIILFLFYILECTG